MDSRRAELLREMMGAFGTGPAEVEARILLAFCTVFGHTSSPPPTLMHRFSTQLRPREPGLGRQRILPAMSLGARIA